MNNGFYLKGKRVFFREVRETDVNEQYYYWLNDPDINKYLETRFIPRSMDNIRGYVKEKSDNDKEPFFAICLVKDSRHIGNIKLGPINWVHRKADVSLFIGAKELWGQGYGAEAISLLTYYAFSVLGLNKLKAGAYAENKASIKVFKQCGFKQEGVLEGEVIIDGQEMDGIILGLRATNWKGGKKD